MTEADARRAALRAQGKYMGAMRGLPAARCAIVKKVRVEKGIMATVTSARGMAC